MSLIGISCIFTSPNIKKTETFYVEKLGFKAVEYLECTDPHVCLYKDEIEIILLKSKDNKIYSNRELYGYGYDAYLYTYHVEKLEEEFRDKGVKIVKSVTLTDYNNKEFVIEDTDGRWLAFGLKEKKK